MGSITGPLYAGAAAAGTDWTTVSNAVGPPDGTTANNVNQGPGGGGHTPSQLGTSSHGFSIPATAVIDGILLEANVYGDTGSSDQFIAVGNGTKTSTTTPNFGQIWPATLAYLSWGGPTALWGQTWTPADINSTNFGASISAIASHSTGTIEVDAVRITIYWHTAFVDVVRRYIYKVYRGGVYLGNLPQPTSEFTLSLDINTAGSQITIQVPVSVDVALLPTTNVLTDESGVILTDENGNSLQGEGAANLVGVGTGTTLIKNGNQVVVWEYGYYYPNGHIKFNGKMERIEANFGGDAQDNTVNILCYSDGSDLDNYMLLGSPFTYTVDQSQVTQNASGTLDQSSSGSYDYYAQTFTIGTGQTNLGALYLLLNGSGLVTVTVYQDTSMTIILASSAVNVSTSGVQEVLFGFANHILITAGLTYFFTVTIAGNQSITIYYNTSNVYAGGTMYTAAYAGGSGGGSYAPVTGADLYFKSASSSGQTTANFSSMDPTTGMLVAFMNDYHSRGGLIKVNSGSVQATGLNLSYTFNTNTIYEGIQAVLSISPNGFYYYVDLATDILYFKQANTQADILLTKGVHINKLTIVASIENIYNMAYFSGGNAGAGTNIYKLYQDAPSIALYGQKLQRLSDNRVTSAGVADAIGTSAIMENKNEQYLTTVTVLDKTMDISALHPGLIVGFRGFGSFADTLLAQIVRIDYTPETATLQLGVLPRRLNIELENITRDLIAQQTIANPTGPS